MTLSDDIKRVLELYDREDGLLHGEDGLTPLGGDFLQEAPTIRKIIEQQQELLREAYGALKAIGEHYVALAACGDCGFWNPEKEKEVIQYRATLAKIKTALGDV